MENYDYIDVHSHLNFKDFDQDRTEIIAEMQKNKIATITVGTGFITSQESLVLAEEYENVFACVGLHPVDFQQETFKGDGFEQLVTHKKVVAIGECGLDYAHMQDISDIGQEKSRQKKEFEMQIEFAMKYDKPLMIHCRDAYPDTIDILKSKQQQYGSKIRGNFHFFTSPIDIAKLCLDIGFTVSFTGPITFAKEYEEIVKYVPLNKILIETDAPYASPAPYRGKRNSPLYVPEIAKKVAAVKGIDIDIIRKQLVKNTTDLFFKNISSLIG